MSGCSLKDEVKKVVSSLLVPHCKGLPLDKFLREYKEYETRNLPFRQLGYNSPLEFFHSIPDVVRIFTLPSGHTILQAAANENTMHIQELVKGQRNTNSASVRTINNLLRGHLPPPLPYRFMHRTPVYHQAGPSRNNQQPNMLGYQSKPQPYTNRPKEPYGASNQSFNGHKPSYYEHDDRLKTTDPIPAQKPSASIAPSFSSPSSESLHYEREVISNVTKLLQSYPQGVHLSRLYDLYENAFKEPIVLPRIEKGISSIKFLQKHSSVFHIWTDHDQQSMVRLREALERKDSPPSVEPCPAVVLKTSGGPSQVAMNEAAQYNFASVDARVVRNPTSSSFQTVTLLPVVHDRHTLAASESSASRPSMQRVSSLVRSSQTRQSSNGEGNLPATFGVSRPKIKNVVTETTIFLHEDFPADLDPFDFFFVIVGEVYSPGKFYWFFSENKQAIESLTDDMVAFYNVNHGYEMNRSELYIGQIVAAMYTDGLWYRGRIMGTYRDEIEVFYIDYGSTCAVGIDRLRHLHMVFTKLPVQAFLSRIFGVLPYPKEGVWSVESGKFLLSTVKGSKIVAAAVMSESVVEIRGEKVREYAISLVDTTQENDVHVADELITRGYAILDQEEVHSTSLPLSVMDSPSTVGPSPQPTCPFPLPDMSSLSLSGDPVLGSQTVDSGISSNWPVKRVPVALESNCASPLHDYSETSSARGKEKAKRFVKQLRLRDGRLLHIVKESGVLHLPALDMPTIIPSFEDHMASMKLIIEEKKITHECPHIFLDCVKVGAPWIRDDEGEILRELVLHPIDVVLQLLQLLKVRDKEAVGVIEEYNSNPDDPFFS